MNGILNKKSKEEKMENKTTTKEKGKWLEEYECGCTFVAKKKKELIGYCSYHGENRINLYKLEKSKEIEVGHSMDE